MKKLLVLLTLFAFCLGLMLNCNRVETQIKTDELKLKTGR